PAIHSRYWSGQWLDLPPSDSLSCCSCHPVSLCPRFHPASWELPCSPHLKAGKPTSISPVFSYQPHLIVLPRMRSFCSERLDRIELCRFIRRIITGNGGG